MSSLNKKFPRLLPEPIRKGMKVADLIDTTFKAYNPFERLKSMPEDKHHFMHMFSNHKGLNGIQHFFNFGEEDEHRGEFL